ncbi:MAG: alanine racemase [Micrococcales bacterium]|nr:alanine racemase [Micrococcales bacterium]
MSSSDLHGQDGNASGPARVLVDLDAIAANVSALCRRVGDTAVLAVVKADAYGHGLVPSARAALGGGATWLGTAQIGEALALRAAGVDAPLLAWLYAPGAPFRQAVEADIDLGVSAPWALVEIAEAAAHAGRPARIHLKIDTGLARNGAFGAGVDELIEAAARTQDGGRVRVVGIMSHFARADEPGEPSIRGQQDRFEAVYEQAQRAGLGIQIRHLANSAAVLTNPSASYDLVRPGLAIYGLSPVPQLGTPEDFGLRPAMRVAVDVALVKDIPGGQGVSYGHTYTTVGATRVVLLPIGYADGVPRGASNCAPVSLDGRHLRISGRVCMDQLVVDVGDLPVRPGDEAILFGDAGRGEPTAQEWADATGTISYEIVTRMSSRLPRSYAGAAAWSL